MRSTKQEAKSSVRCKFNNMLNTFADYERDTTSAKLIEISRQLPVSLLDVSAASREPWWMNQE
jgi:hypothetical protein